MDSFQYKEIISNKKVFMIKLRNDYQQDKKKFRKDVNDHGEGT